MTFEIERLKGRHKSSLQIYLIIVAKICIINHSPCPPGTAQGVMAFALQQGSFSLSVSQSHLTIQTVQHRNELPWEVVKSPSVESYRSQLAKQPWLRGCWSYLMAEGWTRWLFKVSSQPHFFLLMLFQPPLHLCYIVEHLKSRTYTETKTREQHF